MVDIEDTDEFGGNLSDRELSPERKCYLSQAIASSITSYATPKTKLKLDIQSSGS